MALLDAGGTIGHGMAHDAGAAGPAVHTWNRTADVTPAAMSGPDGGAAGSDDAVCAQMGTTPSFRLGQRGD